MPIVVILLGFWVNQKTKRLEHLQWRSQKLVEKRLAVYDDLAPDLNDFLCYFTFVGLWKELRPPDVVALKRKVDRKIHSESVSDPEHIREAYQEVMKAFACDIGVHPSASIPPSGAVPANIR